MNPNRSNLKRRGAVVPLLAVCLVGLMSFLALAIDIGVMAVARNQAQNAADISALAGARTLNGISSANFNVTNALAMASTAATNNSILATSITSAQVTTAQAGIYEYSTSAQRFQAVFGSTPSGTQTYGCVQVTLTTQQPTFFANVMGISSMNVSATATAVHRPNDVSIVLDFSGSMGYSSQINYYHSQTQSLSPDSTFPQMGPYSVFTGAGMILDYSNPGTAPANETTYTPTNPMQRIWPYVDSSGYLYAPNNLTMETAAGPAIVSNFLLTDYSTNAFVNSSSSSGSFPTFYNINDTAHYSSNPTAVCTPAPSTFVSDNVSNFVGDPFPLRIGVFAAAGEQSVPSGSGITATTTIATGTAPTPSQYAQCIADILGLTRANVTNTTIVPLWETNGYDYAYAQLSGSISGATKASPIVITTSANHGLSTNDYVTITGVKGNTAANGSFTITVLTATTFSLDASTGNANYTSAGTWTGVHGYQKAVANRFQGFTMGPAYWGKTFYMWPPDPRAPSSASVAMGSAGYVAGDWRQRFFLPKSGSGDSMQDNSVFWDGSGNWQNQNPGSSANFMVNYSAVLAWLTSGPRTLPASLCAGHVLYYSSIPTSISTSLSTGVISSGATADQAFWKDYIDYVLGAGRWSATYDNNGSPNMYGCQSANSNTGGGSTLYYNNPSSSNLSPQITALSSLTGNQKTGSVTAATNASPIVITSASHGLSIGNAVTISGVNGNTAANGDFIVSATTTNTFTLSGTTGSAAYTSGGTWTANVPCMNYTDTPIHPRMQFWFGPLSLLGYLHDFAAGNLYNWMPGNSYEAQCWQLKAGIQAALQDIQNNHPNHLASLIFYSGSNGYSTARVGMSLNYADMKNCLYFPYSLLSTLSTSSSTIRPYSNGGGSNGNPAGLTDTSDTVIPNAGTDTNPQMGFMAAYNQFSNATDTSVSPSVTYAGRQTAGKVVIFETDGCPNDVCSGTLTGSGSAGNYYYGSIGNANYVGLSTSLNVTPKTDACTVVQHIAASTTASTPGYSTTRNPAYVHAVAFGDLFESTSTSTLTPAALRFLCAVQMYGNTSSTPSGSTVPAPGTMASWYTDSLSYSTYYSTPQSWKIITGTYTTRIANINTCITNIMQSGVQVALIQ